MVNPKRDPRSVLLGSIIGNFLHIWSLYLIRVTKRWLSANDIEWNILLKKFINQRRTLISVLGSVTGKSKNPCTWSLLYIYMLFYCWSCIIDFASSDLRSMNLLYLRYCYLILSMSMLCLYIYISEINGMIIWIWHI